jgi:probable rRNA maturation factor
MNRTSPRLPPPEIDLRVEAGGWPPEKELRRLAENAIKAAVETLAPLPEPPRQGGREISLLFTDDAEIKRLNASYRNKNTATNVLSFPQDSGPLLGDIVLGFETVAKEAALAKKPLDAHIAHLIVHGFFHLIGYDHQVPEEAEIMEDLERAALRTIGIADPYATAEAK